MGMWCKHTCIHLCICTRMDTVIYRPLHMYVCMFVCVLYMHQTIYVVHQSRCKHLFMMWLGTAEVGIYCMHTYKYETC